LIQLPTVHTIPSEAPCFNMAHSKLRPMRQQRTDQSTGTCRSVGDVHWIWISKPHSIRVRIATIITSFVVILDLQALKSRKGEMQWVMGLQLSVRRFELKFEMQLKDRG